MNTKATIENGAKVYMIFHNCLCCVTIDSSSASGGITTYHVKNSEVYFPEDEIGKTVFFTYEEAEKAMKLLTQKHHFCAEWATVQGVQCLEFDIESNDSEIFWIKAVHKALLLAKESHSRLDKVEYLWTE